jgi:hypothetical protein
MLAALAVIALTQSGTRTVELYDGATIDYNGSPYRYWYASDTHIEARTPNQNYGGDHILVGGSSSTILIKFGDLNRAAAGKRKVTSASLILTSAGREPRLKSIRALQTPWGEGPLNTLGTPPSEKAPKGSATWRERRAGSIAWAQSGAASTPDSQPIEGATATFADGKLTITGLAPVVQNQLDAWHENHGFALTFDGPSEFFSGNSPTNRPKLILELSDAEPNAGPDLSVTMIDRDKAEPRNGEQVTYTATIKNVGSAPAPTFGAAWVVNEKRGSGLQVTKTLAPGEETTLTTTKAFQKEDDHRFSTVGLKLEVQDANKGNNYLEINENARPVSVQSPSTEGTTISGSGAPEDNSQERVRILNDILSESRYSFAPEGATIRFRLAKGEMTMAINDPVPGHSLARALTGALLDLQNQQITPDEVQLLHNGKRITRGSIDRFPGLSGGGSTLIDSSVLGALWLPYEPVYNQIYESIPLQDSGLLAATTVASFKATDLKSMLPPTTVVRASDTANRPLANADLHFYQSEDGKIPNGPPTFTVKTSAGGTAVIPAARFQNLAADGKNGVFMVATERFGTWEWSWLKAWQLLDARARTGSPAVFVEVQFNLPSDPIDTETNLALNKVPADSANTLPARLINLVDGKLDTEIDLPNEAGAWIELDLGRDRPIAELNLTGSAFWDRFDIQTYGTGESATGAQIWARELDFSWSIQNRADSGTLRYRGPRKTARYIRITAKESGPAAKLSEIQVLAAGQE